MKVFIKYLMFFLFLLVVNTIQSQEIKENLADYVNPFIGTANGGNTNPGAICPFGMMSICPNNSSRPLKKGEKPYPIYVHTNRYFSGFTHTNLSGVGCPDLGALTIMPISGKLEIDPEKYACLYTDEKAVAGYYRVKLPEYDIEAEVSATLRTGIERFSFSEGEAHILFDAGRSTSDIPGAYLKINSPTEIVGHKMIGNFCGTGKQSVIYFVVQMGKEPDRFGCWQENLILDAFTRDNSGNHIGAFFSYDLEKEEDIVIKIGVSYVSIENARMNLEHEQKGFNFDKVCQDAYKEWNNKLSRIQVEGNNEKYKQMFYTGIYHMLIHPNILNDVNGDYPAYITGQTKKVQGRNRFSIFSLWDTYRNVHPFLSLVFPEYQSEMIKSILDMYKEGGRLPKWELSGMETDVMVGDPAVIVIADTYIRGIRDFDVALAYEAMKKNATTLVPYTRPGYNEHIEKGYIPELRENENREGPWVWGSVSTGLEYCMCDFAMSRMALALNKESDYQLFDKYSQLYRNYFDTNIRCMRPRWSNGCWVEPFSAYPNQEEWWNQIGFVEGCTWHYSMFVPFDIKGLIELYGGERKFIQKLEDCFKTNNFNIANEPDIAYPYLFNYVKGEERKTQYWVRKCIDTYFGNDHNGIMGNDDCGTMSAWLVYSMMGLYPDCPAKDTYQLTTPLFDKITIKLHQKYYKGDKFIITAGKNADEKNFIDGIRINGEISKKYFITNDQVTNGGILTFSLK